jgi:hypothetical protein
MVGQSLFLKSKDQASEKVDRFLAKRSVERGRLIFALDATESRRPRGIWRRACRQRCFARRGASSCS